MLRGNTEMLAEDTLKVIDETQSFTVQTDGSNIAIPAILHQGIQPVAFFSRTQMKTQMK